MTFRQILNILWQRRLIIVAMVVLAVAISALFLYRQTPVYSSSTVVRLSTQATSAITSGQVGTAPVDFDPSNITSPAVLAQAATLARESRPDALNGQVTYKAGDGTQANRLTITAEGPTAAASEDRANAVVKAYTAYLEDQTQKAKAAAQKQATTATAAAQAAQAQVSANPANSIAQSNLATALKTLGDANAVIDEIDNAGPPIRVVTAAAPGEFQGVTPLIALGVALAAGLVAGIGVALIRDQFDNRLRGEHELEELTGLSALGELSLDKRVARRKESLPAAARKRTALNEGIRALRTTLQVLLSQDKSVVVFTSVEPGDGKTFVSANIALAWARTGKRVILVGGDLRRPTLADYYGEAADGSGLTELLQSAAHSGKAPSKAEIEGLLNDSGFRNLRILPAGAEPHAPADLLTAAALEKVFEHLRTLSDIVVIDSPPAMALVDASLLAAKADGAVLVASVRRTNRERLTETVHILKGNGVTVLGAIANRSRQRVPRSYGAYYGRSKGQRGDPTAAREGQSSERASESAVDEEIVSDDSRLPAGGRDEV